MSWSVFEDFSHEQSMVILLSLTDPGVLKQSKLTNVEINTIREPSSRKTTATNKKKFAVSLIE